MIRRPVAGWSTLILGVIAVLTPAIAASQSPLRPLAGPIAWAGLFGLLIGIDGATPSQRKRAPSRLALFFHALAHTTVWMLGAALLILAAGEALPPSSLVWQDLSRLVAHARGVVDEGLEAARSGAFLASSVARLSTDLGAAPQAGDRGARLLLSVVGAVIIWVSALTFGRGLGAGRPLLPRMLPLLAGLALIALPGGEGGFVLALGTGIALLCIGLGGFTRRLRGWDARGTDYSDEITRDVVLWTGLLGLVTLIVAWVIPLWPGNPLARAFDAIGASGSGLAALERGATSSGGAPTVEIGLSTLPSLRLGVSISQGPPEQPALQVSLNQPLDPALGPNYWRARVFNVYNGITWSADAHVTTQPAIAIVPDIEDTIVQDIQDLRPDKQLLVGLANIIGASIPVRVERFEDGDLAVMAGDPPEVRYQVLSRPMPLAELPALDREAPDMSLYLGLPGNIPPRVGELTQAITRDSRDDLSRALAIEAYLRELPYRYEVAPIPSGGDAVDQFLFDMRSGYCTYYASAMAVMARSIGIPSRVSIGYATGALQPDGTYLVRETDAHAWPELYISGRWTAFEPTPALELPQRGTPSGSVPVVDKLPVKDAVKPRVDLIPIVLVGLVLIGLLAWLIVQYRRQIAIPDQLAQATETLAMLGARLGLPWPSGATVREYGRAIEARLQRTVGAIQLVIDLVERGRYSNTKLTIEESTLLEDARGDLDHVTDWSADDQAGRQR
jgi:transglutaminase-like putative cysteine protease